MCYFLKNLYVSLIIISYFLLRHHSQTSSHSTGAQPLLHQTILLCQWGVCSPGPQMRPAEGLCGWIR